jgi:Ketopantoate reductase PanE/ApbA C terminal
MKSSLWVAPASRVLVSPSRRNTLLVGQGFQRLRGRRKVRARETRVLPGTETMGPDKPSTLLDWEAGKWLEIEAIWGEPLRRAAAAAAQMQGLEIVYALLKHFDLARQCAPGGAPEPPTRANLTALSSQVCETQ